MTERFASLRMRNKSSEQERHEFAVIDAAVRGAGTDRPEDAELTDFALRMSSARSLPNDGFYRELDERFAASESGEEAIPPRRRISTLAMGGGALASILVAVVIVSAIHLRSNDSVDVMSLEVAAPTEEGVPITAMQKRAAAPAVADSAAGNIAPARPGQPRKVATTANITLATRGNNVETVADGVIRVTDETGGYVRNSSVTGGDGGAARASFYLQLPAASFQDALAGISKLAHVQTRTQRTRDITEPFADSRVHLRIARAQRDRLVTLYAGARAGSPEAAVLKIRLKRAQSRVDARNAELSRLQNRVNFVGLSVLVDADQSAAVDDRGTLNRAVHAAGNVLTSIAAMLLIGLAVALPIALFAALVWAITTRVKRRRRNVVVDDLVG
jgi:hypothetical protein